MLIEKKKYNIDSDKRLKGLFSIIWKLEI